MIDVCDSARMYGNWDPIDALVVAGLPCVDLIVWLRVWMVWSLNCGCWSIGFCIAWSWSTSTAAPTGFVG